MKKFKVIVPEKGEVVLTEKEIDEIKAKHFKAGLGLRLVVGAEVIEVEEEIIEAPKDEEPPPAEVPPEETV